MFGYLIDSILSGKDESLPAPAHTTHLWVFPEPQHPIDIRGSAYTEAMNAANPYWNPPKVR